MISEYANAGFGLLMVLGLASWSASLACTAVVARSERVQSYRTTARGAVVGLLITAAAGILVTACFKTQAIAGVVPPGTRLTRSGRLHDLGSGIATLALFGAVVASIRAIGGPGFRRWALIALVTALSCDLILLAVGREVGGLRRRVLVAIACAWQAALLVPRNREA
jgi:Protein of unknown function (DUF998)